MIELGKIQTLKVKNIGKIGALLCAFDNDREDVILSSREMEQELQIGDSIEVFVYKNTEDDLVATLKMPKVQVGEIEYLRVIDVAKVGAFLEWGLDKDLFIPYKEQRTELRKGQKYLVGLYVDKSNRLCATMDIYKVLRSDSPYNVNDKAEGLVYDVKEDMGVFVAVDKKYHGLIPKSELYKTYVVGDEVEVRIINVREDGKLDLSTREKAYLQMDRDAEMIMEKLRERDGVIYLNDDSSAENIKLQLNISKKAFKRSVGMLLKEAKIEFIEDGIKLKGNI